MKFIKKHLIILTIFIILIALISTISLKYYLNHTKKMTQKEEKIEEIFLEEPKKEEIKPQTVYIDVKGAVNKPGVYEIEENKKVIDVITLAGGFTDNADTSMINLAKKVTNEMVVIIYTKEEVKKAQEPNQIIKYVDKECICPNIKNDACLNNTKEKETEKKVEPNTQATKPNKVNINTATLEELQTLSGIGESKAQAIINYREEKGSFKNIEELKEVSGIGDSLYEKIKDSITV